MYKYDITAQEELYPFHSETVKWAHSCHLTVTSITNTSLENGKFPTFFKQVHVTPLLITSQRGVQHYRLVSKIHLKSS